MISFFLAYSIVFFFLAARFLARPCRGCNQFLLPLSQSYFFGLVVGFFSIFFSLLTSLYITEVIRDSFMSLTFESPKYFTFFIFFYFFFLTFYGLVRSIYLLYLILVQVYGFLVKKNSYCRVVGVSFVSSTTLFEFVFFFILSTYTSVA